MSNAAETRLVIPALSGIYEAGHKISWPLTRFIVGILYVPHGYIKLFQGGASGTAESLTRLGLEPALPLAYYLGILEFFGGICLAIGLLTRLMAIQFVVFMAVAVFYVHWDNGFLWTEGGFEYPLMWGVLALVILFRGGGQWSVDRAIGKEL